MKARENANRFNDIELISIIDEVKENSFERIMMWHVLEHVADINEVFKSIKKMLKKEGKLVIAITNPRANEIKNIKKTGQHLMFQDTYIILKNNALKQLPRNMILKF